LTTLLIPYTSRAIMIDDVANITDTTIKVNLNDDLLMVIISFCLL
jgi:hypothetical protein